MKINLQNYVRLRGAKSPERGRTECARGTRIDGRATATHSRALRDRSPRNARRPNARVTASRGGGAPVIGRVGKRARRSSRNPSFPEMNRVWSRGVMGSGRQRATARFIITSSKNTATRSPMALNPKGGGKTGTDTVSGRWPPITPAAGSCSRTASARRHQTSSQFTGTKCKNAWGERYLKAKMFITLTEFATTTGQKILNSGFLRNRPGSAWKTI